MLRLTAITGFFLFLAAYEMSGGTDFAPGAQRDRATVATAEPVKPQQRRATTTSFPTRAATNDYVPFNTPIIVRYEASAATPVAHTRDTADQTAHTPLRTIAGNRVNIRSGPSTGHRIVTTLPSGTATHVLQSEADWVQVKVSGSDHIGWVAAHLLHD